MQISKFVSKLAYYVETRRWTDLYFLSDLCCVQHSKYMIDKMIKTKQTIINKANRKVDLVEKFNTQSYKYPHNHNATYDQWNRNTCYGLQSYWLYEFAIKRGLSSLDKPGYVNRHCCKINDSCLIHLFDFACAVATSFTCLTQSW